MYATQCFMSFCLFSVFVLQMYLSLHRFCDVIADCRRNGYWSVI